ncbi:YdeI/OmpD-associated family protein [Sphingomonas crusticola]|uniref:YdeI/OmpD-associated family protein n=1 Tax=Sphingomonas crusticola TaxID=1697973 RepID=UPI000E24753D|nr:YdeI/OmpD-associated family protein [Sphingomonas crusticola]
MTTAETRAGLLILGFADASAFAAWLAAQPAGSAGLWLKLAKRGSNIASLSKAEAIHVALCHGWIDGQLHPYDEACWLIRFTPRKRGSKWSEKNRTRALELIAQGRMQPSGMAEVEAAQKDGRWEAAYAPASTAEVPPDLQAALDADPAAAAFFATLTGANRYAILYRIGAVKKAETRARKIAHYVAMLARGETLH